MRLKIILLLLISLFIFPQKIYADQDFDISTNTTYDVMSSGITKITQDILIKNKTDYIYTPSYTITSGLKNLENLRVSNQDGYLPNTLKDLGENGKSIEVSFPKRVVGKGNVNEFQVSFETDEITKRKGSIWEVSIPGLLKPDEFSGYNATLRVPQNFDSPTIVKPLKNFSNTNRFNFNKDEIGKSGIFLIFGNTQFYNLDLSYHIANSKLVPIKTEVALPPNTPYQDVRIKSINPKPEDVYRDADGNWMAVYNLNPGETKNINARVLVQVHAKPVFEEKEPQGLTSASKYWETGDPEIKKLARELKTPMAIYDFVAQNLSYNYNKIANNNVRLGAKESLLKKDYAVCLEFTDLFVGLSRAAGIKARSIEGFAYTQNSKLRPLSLVKDVLHSWPEYYDENTNAWVMVDPTWGNTTHGMDYFNSLDFDHIAFAINGESSTYPIPAGGYKVDQDSKDVKVTFADSSEFSDISKTALSANFPSRIFSGIPVSGSIIIENQGNFPYKTGRVIIDSDLTPAHQEFLVNDILPYGKKTINLEFSKTPFLTNKAYKVKIQFDGTTLTKNVSVGIFPNYILILGGGVLIGGSIIVAWASYKTWSLYISKRKG